MNHRLQDARDGKKPDSGYGSANFNELSALRTIDSNVGQKSKTFLKNNTRLDVVQEICHQKSQNEKKPNSQIQGRIQQCRIVDVNSKELKENDSSCAPHKSENKIDLTTAEEYIDDNKSTPHTNTITTTHDLNDSPNSPLMKTDKHKYTIFSNNGPRTAEEIESILKNKFKNSSTLQSIRDHIDSVFNAEDLTVVKVEITLPASCFDESNLTCDEYGFSTIHRDLPVGWLTFLIKNKKDDYFTSMTCYPISEGRQQKSKIIFYHNNQFNSSLPENSKLFMNNTDMSVEHEYDKRENVLKANSKEIIIVVIILGCAALLYLMLYLFIPDYHRGFFCNDESLMYPFHESTVSHELLYSIGVLVPVLTIVFIENIRKMNKIDDRKNPMIFGRSYPLWLKHVVKFCGIFMFGALSTVMITSIVKNSIGRYRPHFINVCQPIIPPGNTTCSDPANTNRYIINFFCNNADLTAEMRKEMQLSLPSGHASFSVYTMTFAALYLYCRLNWSHGYVSRSAKICLTSTFIASGFLISLSRISNYQSHWSDVLAGSSLGLFICFIIVFVLSNLFKNRWDVRRVKHPVGSE